jgi:hypothetical protein
MQRVISGEDRRKTARVMLNEYQMQMITLAKSKHVSASTPKVSYLLKKTQNCFMIITFLQDNHIMAESHQDQVTQTSSSN